ncbi:MAG: histidine kinase dimerization/phospho-acceptor domain-containing protein [Lachnospiraceae bacterium]|nr:histidine kinase dimerization/phospho-acceptor domain-containing protein [Lachnospiraceae bacterium]
MKKIKHSLAGQIALIFMLVTGTLIAATLLINRVFLERFYTQQLEQTLEQAYRGLDEHIDEEYLDAGYFSGEFSQLVSSNNISLVVVDRNYNSLIATNSKNSDIMEVRLFGYTAGLEKGDAQILKETERYTIQKKNDERMKMAYLEMWGSISAGGFFMMRIPLESIRINAAISMRFMVYFSVLAVLVCIALSVWISRQITRPVRELTELSKRMAELDFDAKYTSGGKNEIGQLGDHFNQMSETLESSIAQLKSANLQLEKDIEAKTRIDEMRREFLASVSHELKTPLALIQGYAEGLQEGICEDEESRNFYCEVIMDEAGKMDNMVRKLMELMQLESGENPEELERFDLAEMIQDKVAEVQILAQPKDISIEYQGPEKAFAWGPPFKVEEVLTNYLSNAMNHAEGERRILVSLTQRDGVWRTGVRNTGKLIPEEALDRVWEKFYKVDKARTREYGGSGVGLSIVKAIMDSLGQGFGVRNCEDGVEFWFELDGQAGLVDAGNTADEADD